MSDPNDGLSVLEQQRSKAESFGIPLAVLAELTHRCPLQCPYCSNPLELDRASTELTTEEWKKVLSELAELGVLQIHFSGGDGFVQLALLFCAQATGQQFDSIWRFGQNAFDIACVLISQDFSRNHQGGLIAVLNRNHYRLHGDDVLPAFRLQCSFVRAAPAQRMAHSAGRSGTTARE